MPKPLDNYFAFNHAAMTVKSQRLELISGNIANASTPGFKAKDLGHFDGPGWTDKESAITYHVPLAPSLDNNTVEIGIEQAKYGRAIADYQASLQFMESKISGLRKALRGE